MTHPHDMTRPGHHPEESLLLDFAAGSVSEPAALVVATHAAMCPACRLFIRQCEQFGGALLDALEPATLDSDSFARTLDMIDGDGHEAAAAPPSPAPPALVPAPLQPYTGGDLERIAWHWAGVGLRRHSLSTAVNGHTTTLLRGRPGARDPRHRHEGCELTVVLRGALSDRGEIYRRGDVMTASANVDHAPDVCDEEECICLVSIEGRIRLTGPIGRLFNVLLK